MWNVKTNVVPLVIGATATISKSLRKCLGYIPGKHEIKKLQKTAILGTPLHLQEISPIPGTHLCYRPSRADGHTADNLHIFVHIHTLNLNLINLDYYIFHILPFIKFLSTHLLFADHTLA